MFEVVGAGEPCGPDRGAEVYRALADRTGDIYYDLEYLRTTERANGGKLRVAIFRDGEAAVAYPFILRAIDGSDRFDIITPYEFGGPLSIGTSAALRESFERAFGDYCRQQGVVAEFVRFDPFRADPHLWGRYRVEQSCDNVVIDLSRSEETLWREYHKNNRRDVRIARRRGVEIRRMPLDAESVGVFLRIYYPLMDMRQAKAFYYFSEEYFRDLARLGSERASLYCAFAGTSAVSASFFLHKNGVTYYHLSGTVRDAAGACPGNLLLHTAITDRQQAGDRWFHLGGAPASQPGLYRFKSKFSKIRVPYFVGKNIVDRDAYEALVREWGKRHGRAASGTFFPAYRQT